MVWGSLSILPPAAAGTRLVRASSENSASGGSLRSAAALRGRTVPLAASAPPASICLRTPRLLNSPSQDEPMNGTLGPEAMASLPPQPGARSRRSDRGHLSVSTQGHMNIRRVKERRTNIRARGSRSDGVDAQLVIADVRLHVHQ